MERGTPGIHLTALRFESNVPSRSTQERGTDRRKGPSSTIGVHQNGQVGQGQFGRPHFVLYCSRLEWASGPATGAPQNCSTALLPHVAHRQTTIDEPKGAWRVRATTRKDKPGSSTTQVFWRMQCNRRITASRRLSLAGETSEFCTSTSLLTAISVGRDSPPVDAAPATRPVQFSLLPVSLSLSSSRRPAPLPFLSRRLW